MLIDFPQSVRAFCGTKKLPGEMLTGVWLIEP